MYFVARKVSMPSIESLLKKEKAESAHIYNDFSDQLNDLINKYFRTENEGKLKTIGLTRFRNDGNRDCRWSRRKKRINAITLY